MYKIRKCPTCGKYITNETQQYEHEDCRLTEQIIKAEEKPWLAQKAEHKQLKSEKSWLDMFLDIFIK